MQEIQPLAAAIGTYGLYTIIACLVVAVVYLFKKINDLHKEIQNILQQQLKDQADVLTKCTRALEDSSKALENIQNFVLMKQRAGTIDT